MPLATHTLRRSVAQGTRFAVCGWLPASALHEHATIEFDDQTPYSSRPVLLKAPTLLVPGSVLAAAFSGVRSMRYAFHRSTQAAKPIRPGKAKRQGPTPKRPRPDSRTAVAAPSAALRADWVETTAGACARATRPMTKCWTEGCQPGFLNARAPDFVSGAHQKSFAVQIYANRHLWTAPAGGHPPAARPPAKLADSLDVKL